MSKDAHQELKRMRRWMSGLGSATLAVSVAGTAWFDTAAVAGLLLGGAAGLVGFWLLATRVERLRGRMPQHPERFWAVWTAARFGLYAAALLASWFIDPARLYALIAAAAGLLLMQPVQMAAAFLSLNRDIVKQDDDGKRVEREP
ncbi:MAG TPA: ATP synthase subunit I [Candidatus Hydrogenedentes bacterium]|nr:ATP synthase subunit I [Candidatus Hydrogenedentota bacterium]